MEKHKLGWLINGILAIGTIATSIIFPNPAIIFPVVAGATLTGTIQSMFTIVESKDEREYRERKTHLKQIATSEDNPKPQKTYENLHSNENQATFKGNHTLILDNIRNNVTKKNVNPATSSTFNVVKSGSKKINDDSYTMANDENTLER